MNTRPRPDHPDEPPDDLPAMLRAGAAGHVPTQAAIELLIRHGHWPDRLHRDGHVTTWPADNHGPAMATIDWRTVAQRLHDHTEHGLAASSSERSVLTVAASLVSSTDVRLGQVLPCLDATNTGLVATAIADACNSGVHVTIHRHFATTHLDALLATMPRVGSASSDPAIHAGPRP